jgi:hypothetical protein
MYTKVDSLSREILFMRMHSRIKYFCGKGYSPISEAKITGLLDEAEDEAEASPLFLVIALQSYKGLHVDKGSFLLQKSGNVPFSPAI